MRQVGPSAAIVAVALAFALAGGATAQTQTGSIVGVVSANDGNPLPGVTVTLSGSGVMGTKTVVSGENGSYRFTSLIPADDYAVTFELEGLRKAAREGVHVSGGQTVTLDVALELGRRRRGDQRSSFADGGRDLGDRRHHPRHRAAREHPQRAQLPGRRVAVAQPHRRRRGRHLVGQGRRRHQQRGRVRRRPQHQPGVPHRGAGHRVRVDQRGAGGHRRSSRRARQRGRRVRQRDHQVGGQPVPRRGRGLLPGRQPAERQRRLGPRGRGHRQRHRGRRLRRPGAQRRRSDPARQGVVQPRLSQLQPDPVAPPASRSTTTTRATTTWARSRSSRRSATTSS